MNVTVIVLTFNEELHIERCIRSLLSIADRIIIVDSYSTDKTLEIARKLGVDIVQNSFINQAQQFQWAIDNIMITTEWILRVDADEFLQDVLQNSILSFLRNSRDFNAVYLRRKINFLGRPIRHGFFYPILILRMYRNGSGRMEQRWMDEHIVVDNPISTTLNGDLVDDNLNSLSWWTAKHVDYAKREAYSIVASRSSPYALTIGLSGPASIKRWLKEKVYHRLPSYFRSTLYFIYRYIIGMGFLDGKEGFFFHFLQAYWYRTYVDATLLEIEHKALARGKSPFELLQDEGIL